MDRKLNGVTFALCQMPVIPGDPRENVRYAIAEIEAAEKRHVDIIMLPEMCLSGYMIGDKFSNEAFVRDVCEWNEKIRVATKGKRIVVIFGSLDVDWNAVGENGEVRKMNTAFIASDGKWLGKVVKTLQPNYSVFDDARHFTSARQLSALSGRPIDFRPIVVPTKKGEVVLGITVCEDAWDEFYELSPVVELAKNGADMIVNLSASPFYWGKNDERHRIVRRLVAKSKLPFVYVNKKGEQNNVKTIIGFDGCSTLYDGKGDIVFEIPDSESGTRDVTLSGSMQAILPKKRDNNRELYTALRAAVSGMFETLPSNMRKAVLGLSGGIDSAVDAALLVDLLGAENVLAITMPSQYTSEETLSLAYEIAENLGIRIKTIPIDEVVCSIARAVGALPGTLAYENIQARVRMEILAAIAQEIGGVFVGNCNKVELAFGYGTLYGDIAGVMLPIGDLVKREVYQVGDYLNRVAFGRMVIPERCFTIAPTAELKEVQKDPFDYGNLTRRGYHDELVRALVDFCKDPEWVLDLYIQECLEKTLMLPDGHLKTLFPTAEAFVGNLEWCWSYFMGSVFKRCSAPPIPKVSLRTFGFDYRESMLPAYYTERYCRLKEQLLG